MRCIRPYLDDDTMINIYYTFFYPHLIYGIEFYGHTAKCHLNQILILQKSAVRIILKIRPRSHVSSYFKTLQIMPIDMLFKYRFLLLFENCFSRGSLQLNRPTFNKTRSKDLFVPKRANNCRGERGGARRAFETARSAGVCAVALWACCAWRRPSGPRGLSAPGAGGSQSTYQSGGRLTSPRLSDHTATVF